MPDLEFHRRSATALERVAGASETLAAAALAATLGALGDTSFRLADRVTERESRPSAVPALLRAVGTLCLATAAIELFRPLAHLITSR
jgi:hypothetical protein